MNPGTENSQPRTFRITIAHLFFLVMSLAVGFAALLNPSRIWSSSLFSLAIILMLWAILRAIALPNGEKLPWIGFALFGLISIGFKFDTFLNFGRGMPAPFPLPVVLLDRSAVMLHERFAAIRPVEASSPLTVASPVGVLQSRLGDFVAICGSLGSIAFALLGALLGTLAKSRHNP